MIFDHQAMRRAAHKRLDELLDQFIAIENGDDLTQSVSGAILLSEAAAFAGSLAGPETMMAVYGTSDATDRPAVLRLLSRRLAVAAGIFRSIWTGDDHSIERVAWEADAVAQGDEPRLFRRLEAKKKRPARAAALRLRALSWNAHLDALGIETAERQGAIVASYGASYWENIRKWRLIIKPVLGGISD